MAAGHVRREGIRFMDQLALAATIACLEDRAVHLLDDAMAEQTGVELPFPVGPATVDGDPPTVKDTLTRQWVKRAAEAA
jgi:hypothetical protein